MTDLIRQVGHAGAPLTKHERLSLQVRKQDEELHRAWRSLTEAPALQARNIREEIEAAAARATRGVRQELRDAVVETLKENAVVIVAGAFVLGAMFAFRR
jgi:hypothetical protein